MPHCSLSMTLRHLRFYTHLSPACIIMYIMTGLAYKLAKILPPSLGWENGFLENTQVVVLITGCLLCLSAAPKIIRKQALVIAGIYLLMIGRELSWGRVFYPTGIITEMGPEFIAMSQIPYHNLIHLAIGIYCLVLLYALLHSFNWHYFWAIPLPLATFSLLFITVAGQITAEHLSLPGLTHPQAQTLEEILELIIYLETLALTWYYGLTKVSLSTFKASTTSVKI